MCRFNGVSFLKKYRGKKIMFVGDSLSLNMWQSLSCMIHSWVPNARTSLIKREGLAELTFLVISQLTLSLPCNFSLFLIFNNNSLGLIELLIRKKKRNY